MRLALVVNPDGSTERVDLDAEGGALAAMQKAVGGLIELVRINSEIEFYCNEEGLYTFTEADFNPYASRMMQRVYGRGYILGSVIFTGGTDEEGETLGLAENMAAMITFGAS